MYTRYVLLLCLSVGSLQGVEVGPKESDVAIGKKIEQHYGTVGKGLFEKLTASVLSKCEFDFNKSEQKEYILFVSYDPNRSQWECVPRVGFSDIGYKLVADEALSSPGKLAFKFVAESVRTREKPKKPISFAIRSWPKQRRPR